MRSWRLTIAPTTHVGSADVNTAMNSLYDSILVSLGKRMTFVSFPFLMIILLAVGSLDNHFMSFAYRPLHTALQVASCVHWAHVSG